LEGEPVTGFTVGCLEGEPVTGGVGVGTGEFSVPPPTVNVVLSVKVNDPPSASATPPAVTVYDPEPYWSELIPIRHIVVTKWTIHKFRRSLFFYMANQFVSFKSTSAYHPRTNH
jgi:hypothetical protein